MSTVNYDDRLHSLGLDRLELRRLHADLITCYKIINNMVAVPFNSFFKFAVSTNTRGHPLKLVTRIPSKRPCTCLFSSCYYCMEATTYSCGTCILFVII